MFELNGFVEQVNEKKINMDAVMVIKDGKVLCLQRFTDNIVHNVFSVAKSFTSTAIGIAVDEGLLKLTDKPYEVFREMMDDQVDVRWKDVTLYNLMTMRSGHEEPYMMAPERKVLRGQTEEKVPGEMMDEWLRYAFTRPMKHQPGEKTRYGNLAPYVAGRMLDKAAGCSVNDYLYEKMWKPLGVAKPQWDCDNAGHTFTASDLYLNIEDMIKLGQIYLGNGVFEGKRYLSEEWVKKATSRLVSSTTISPRSYAADEECGYGLFFWKNTVPGSFRAYGREGQFVIVIPEKNAVIATQAMHSDVQQVLDAVWSQILPQV